MLRAAVTTAVLLAASAAHAQQFTTVHTTREPETRPPLYKTPAWMPQTGLPPEAVIVALIKPPPLPAQSPLKPVVMDGGRGGNIMEHQHRFWGLQQQGASVEMRGGCWSACTLLTSYIPKHKLCFAPGSFLAFHSARTFQSPAPKLEATLEMYRSYPVEIQHWIDDHGGPYKMTVDTYWTLYAPELWAMGYPKCK